jgi:hypothetical protein
MKDFSDDMTPDLMGSAGGVAPAGEDWSAQARSAGDITRMSPTSMLELAAHARLVAPLLRLQPIAYRPVLLRGRRSSRQS